MQPPDLRLGRGVFPRIDRNSLLRVRAELKVALAYLEAGIDGHGDLEGFLLEASQQAASAAASLRNLTGVPL